MNLPIRQLDFGGEIHYRIQGEHHNWNPDTIYKLQHATRTTIPRRSPSFRSWSMTKANVARTCAACWSSSFCRNRLRWTKSEPAKDIVKRFTTGAMSFGSISKEGARDAWPSP